MSENAGNLRGYERKRMLFALKRAGYQTIRYWHEHYAKKHFTRSAVYEYATTYMRYYGRLTRPRAADAKKAPLVFTGNLRDRVLRPLTDAQVSGTAKRTTATFAYGKPPAVVEREQKFIARLVDTYGMTSEQAVAAARKAGQLSGGYGRDMRERFQTLITTLSAPESRRLKEVFLAEYEKAARAWTRRTLGIAAAEA